MADASDQIVHATAVAVGRRAALITGASGSGKSALALEMMTRGATLVADDRAILTRAGQTIQVSCPEPLRGKIEARGIGLLHCDCQERAQVAVVVDLDVAEDMRFPPERHIELLGVALPSVHKVASRHFPAALVQYLKGEGRINDHP